MNQGREELFSDRVTAGRRIYYFDIKETSDGNMYLVISESVRVGDDKKEHHRIFVFPEYIEAFFEGLNNAVNFMNKE